MTVRGKAQTTAEPAAIPEAAQLLLRGYLDHLAHERRLSAHTTANYRRDIESLLRLSAGKAPVRYTQLAQDSSANAKD